MDLQTTKLNTNQVAVKTIFKEICRIQTGDGFHYNFSKIKKLNMEHMDNHGYRVSLNLTFGSMKDHIQIDIAIGEVHEPKKKTLKLYQYKNHPVNDWLSKNKISI